MIDGTVARKTGAGSQFGARLDTVSDFVFVVVCSIKILPLVHVPVWLRTAKRLLFSRAENKRMRS